jgi:hypothetical protein
VTSWQLKQKTEEYVRSRNPLGALTRAWLLCCAIALAACALPPVAGAAATPITPTSLTDCGGTVSADSGGAAAEEPNLLDYKFNCDGGITAYTVIVQQQGDSASGGTIDDYNSAPSVFETDGVTPSATLSITCEGTTPSNGINCNLGTAGKQLTDGYFAVGAIDPIGAYCKHLPTDANGKTITKPGTLAIPKATVQLVVTDYTGAQDGPFTLGSTKKCPTVPNVVPTPKPKTKTKTKSTTPKKNKGTSKTQARAKKS